MTDFVLPNLGDGVAQGDVLKVLVKAGDAITIDQPVLELETDKATVEVPSTLAGVVKEIKVKAGDKVKPGQAVVVIDQGTAEAPPQSGAPKAEAAAPAPAAAPAAPAPAAPAPVAAEPERPRAPVVDFAAARQQNAPVAAAPAAALTSGPAAPSVRRLAREIGVDITQVAGTGPGARISLDDVKEFARRVMSSFGSAGQSVAASSGVPLQVRPLPDFAKFGETERKPMSGIRRKTAEHLSHAWNAIPHVTQFDKADITALEQVRKK